MNGRRKYGAVAAVVVAVVAAAILVAVLLTRDGEPDVTAPQEPETSMPTSTEAEPVLAPLTGLVADDLDHPAVAVKVSDVRPAHPQLGVDRADIVFAEPIGLSYTRLLAVFHTDLPDLVGPVRSVRPMDAPLLGPMARCSATRWARSGCSTMSTRSPTSTIWARCG